MSSPLKGVKVLDFSHLLPGEICSTILSDLGCDVLRVEGLKPGLGQKLPPVIKGESLYYWSLHRNKRRIALDLKQEEGVEVIRELVKEHDVVLENFRPGVMKRLGLDHGTLKKVNKKLVYCSISGYGQGSSWCERPGHDLNFVAEAGILSLTRDDNGRPVLPGVLISDYMSGLYAALSVVSALFDRQRNARSMHLDVSMFESALATLNILGTSMMYTGREPDEESGFLYPALLPNYNVYKCKDDRYLAVASLEPQFWVSFCECIERPDLAKKEPVNGKTAQLIATIAKIIETKTLKQWMKIFEKANCCVSPVNTLKEAFEHLPTREREVVTHMIHPVLGAVPQVTHPVPGKKQKVTKSTANPHEETLKVLGDLGYSKKQIANLAKSKVIAG